MWRHSNLCKLCRYIIFSANNASVLVSSSRRQRPRKYLFFHAYLQVNVPFQARRQSRSEIWSSTSNVTSKYICRKRQGVPKERSKLQQNLEKKFEVGLVFQPKNSPEGANLSSDWKWITHAHPFDSVKWGWLPYTTSSVCDICIFAVLFSVTRPLFCRFTRVKWGWLSRHDFYDSWHLYICRSLFGHSTFFVASLVCLKCTSWRNFECNWAVRSC